MGICGKAFAFPVKGNTQLLLFFIRIPSSDWKDEGNARKSNNLLDLNPTQKLGELERWEEFGSFLPSVNIAPDLDCLPLGILVCEE